MSFSRPGGAVSADILTHDRNLPGCGSVNSFKVPETRRDAPPPVHTDILVPNLFWPAAAGAEPYRGLALPGLEGLLARGRGAKAAGASLERWLAVAYGLPGELPLSPYTLLGEGGDPADAWWMQADPVHLKLHGDQLVLADASRLSLEAGEAEDLVAALNTHFAQEGIAIVAPCPQRWYLRVASEPRVATHPTSDVAGRSIAPFLPGGAEGPRWRRVFNEAQMLLHEHPRNAAREARGALPVNSVWFWGTGRLLRPTSVYDTVWSNHPLPSGLAAASGAMPRSLPEEGELLPADAGGSTQLVVATGVPPTAYGDVDAWRDALRRLDATWFAPMLARLRAHLKGSVTLHGLGPDFSVVVRLSSRDGFRIWRRRLPLAHYAA